MDAANPYIDSTEATAVSILLNELETAGGVAPMSSLSIRVKWGQRDLAGLGNIRNFLKRYSEVFKLEGNTVHLVHAPQAKAVTVPPESANEVLQLGAATLSKASSGPPPAGPETTVAAALSGLSGGPRVTTPPIKAAATPATAALSKAVAAGGMTQAPKVGMQPTPKVAQTQAAPMKRGVGDTIDDGPDSKVARKAPTPLPGSGATSWRGRAPKLFARVADSSAPRTPPLPAYMRRNRQ